jgi:hypothetical protein
VDLATSEEARTGRRSASRFSDAVLRSGSHAGYAWPSDLCARGGSETLFNKRDYVAAELKTWMQPVEAPLPKFLVETGHKAFVYRDPYGVTLIMGPFNGPRGCTRGRSLRLWPERPAGVGLPPSFPQAPHSIESHRYELVHSADADFIAYQRSKCWIFRRYTSRISIEPETGLE